MGVFALMAISGRCSSDGKEALKLQRSRVCDEFIHLRRVRDSHKLIHRTIDSAGVTDFSHVQKMDVIILYYCAITFPIHVMQYIIFMLG